jgi:hypothetical protein
VLGFDWHSSGVTTTVCGALKEATKKYRDMGMIVCGGKGATSRQTPDDIRRACDRTGDPAETLVYASKLTAKVDSAAVQDGYDLYHHCLFFVPGRADWCVVQQGMNTTVKYARRYHWLSERLGSYVNEPHAAVACDRRVPVLNLVAGEGEGHRQSVTALSREHPDRVFREIRTLIEDKPLPLFDRIHGKSKNGNGRSKVNGNGKSKSNGLKMPARHTLTAKDLNPVVLKKVLTQTYERQATDFEELLNEPGLGAQTIRSLSLIAEVIYNAPASRRDPAAYSFAHGGKDGIPYPVNRKLYDANLERLQRAIERARIGQEDKVLALKSLAKFTEKVCK